MTGTELVLGTAQFGLKYGISGRGEPVPGPEVKSILAAAWDHGVRVIDTAPDYGNIEERIVALADGLPFTIISKIPAFPPDVGAKTLKSFVTESIRRTCTRIGKGLSTLLFHRGEDLLGPYAQIAWQAAVEATKGTGIRLGASCYSANEAAAVGAKHQITVAQIPGNAFDQRLASAACLGPMEMHLRSVFLQGLLLMSPKEASARLPLAASAIAAWSSWCKEHELMPLQAALGIVKGLSRVSHCVVGVDRQSHLEDIAAAWERADTLWAPALAIYDENIIDPRRW